MIFILIILSLLFSQEENLEYKNPDGTEFWICFMRNHNDALKPDPNTELNLELFITSDFDANVEISIEALDYYEKIFVPKGTVRNIKINKMAQIKTSEVIEKNRGIHIVSDNPVNVYGLNRRKLTTDTFLALPTSVVGNAYRAVCYDVAVQLMAQFAIVAIEDDTKIQITPTVKTANGKAPNKPFEVSLNKGDVYQVAAANEIGSQLKSDLTGTLVTGNKNFSFFSGHQCAYVPDDIIACNHLVEQLPPLLSWGKHYYIGKLQKRNNYSYRVVANKNGTKIFEDYQLIAVLDAGKFIERTSNKEVQITASEPVLVTQYSQGFKNGDGIGDPMMMLISPTQQFIKKYRFATPVNGYWEHFINVVCPTQAIESIKLNGVPIAKNKFKNFGKSRYSIAYLKVNYGTFELTGDLPFGLSSYGFGYDDDKFDAYGNIGGQSFVEIKEAKDTLAPDADIININSRHKLLIIDDRINDTGIQTVKINYATNFNFKDPEFEKGTPQTELDLQVADRFKDGNLNLTLTDISNNSKNYTVCYSIDPKTGSFRYNLSEGDSECEKAKTYSFGLFAKNSVMNHHPDFSSSGNYTSKGNFQSNRDFNLGFGGVFSLGIHPKYSITGKLYLDKFAGTLNSPDSISIKIRDENQNLIDYKENQAIEIKSSNINLSLGIDYYLNNLFYANAGFRFNYTLGNNILVNTTVLKPLGYSISNANSEIELNSFNQIGIGTYAGVGFQKNIFDSFNLFAELDFDYSFNSLIDDGNWLLWQYYLNLGIKYSL